MQAVNYRSTIKWIVLSAILLLIFGGGLYVGMGAKNRDSEVSHLRSGVVNRVIDGDTIELAGGEVVRYLDIDTPETVHPTKPVQCFGPESTERNIALVDGRTVQLDVAVVAEDSFGRTLAYVYVDDTFVNGELVWGGFAYARSYGESGRLYPTLVRLENSAREAKKGLWEICQR